MSEFSKLQVDQALVRFAVQVGGYLSQSDMNKLVKSSKIRPLEDKQRTALTYLLQAWDGIHLDGDPGSQVELALQRRGFMEKPEDETWHPTRATSDAEIGLVRADYEEVAKTIGLWGCTLRAIVQIECAGSGFTRDGYVKTLFEGHHMYYWLRKHGLDAPGLARQYPSIVYPRWTKVHYGRTPAAERQRLQTAIKIHKPSALLSASYGLPQIMGSNWKVGGFSSCEELVNEFKTGEKIHLQAMANFIKGNGLDKAVKRGDWAAFARGYNGPGYKANAYDVKLANAFAYWKGAWGVPQ